jgi:hypothetical protein
MSLSSAETTAPECPRTLIFLFVNSKRATVRVLMLAKHLDAVAADQPDLDFSVANLHRPPKENAGCGFLEIIVASAQAEHRRRI